MCPLIPNEDLSICRSTHNVLLISFANKGVVHEIRLGKLRNVWRTYIVCT